MNKTSHKQGIYLQLKAVYMHKTFYIIAGRFLLFKIPHKATSKCEGMSNLFRGNAIRKKLSVPPKSKSKLLLS